MTMLPVPLSVAPDPPSHESKWAERTTYSSGSSVPRISPITLAVGMSSSIVLSASTRSFGPWSIRASRHTRP